MKDVYRENRIGIWGFLALLGIGAVILIFVVGGQNKSTINQNNASQSARIELNQLEGCIRGNELRSIIFNSLEHGAQKAEANGEDASYYRREAHRLTSSKYARPDGTIKCFEAVVKFPPSNHQP